MQQWNVSVQRELPGNIITEIAYIGSRGTDLLIGESGLAFGQVDPSYLSLGTALQDQVPNPFLGSSPTRRRRCASPPSPATACCGRIRNTTGSARSASLAPSRSITASRSAPTSASPTGSASSPGTPRQAERRRVDDGRIPRAGGHAAERVRPGRRLLALEQRRVVPVGHRVRLRLAVRQGGTLRARPQRPPQLDRQRLAGQRHSDVPERVPAADVAGIEQRQPVQSGLSVRTGAAPMPR